jgi:hypothetical protein
VLVPPFQNDMVVDGWNFIRAGVSTRPPKPTGASGPRLTACEPEGLGWDAETDQGERSDQPMSCNPNKTMHRGTICLGLERPDVPTSRTAACQEPCLLVSRLNGNFRGAISGATCPAAKQPPPWSLIPPSSRVLVLRTFVTLSTHQRSSRVGCCSPHYSTDQDRMPSRYASKCSSPCLCCE